METPQIGAFLLAADDRAGMAEALRTLANMLESGQLVPHSGSIVCTPRQYADSATLESQLGLEISSNLVLFHKR